MAGRPLHDLSRFRDSIIEQFEDGSSYQQIATYLQDQHSIPINSKTIQRRLRDWGIYRNTKNDDSPELRARIIVLLFECCLNDDDILYILKKEGYSLNKLGLRRLRTKMGLIRRVSPQNRAEADQLLLDLVQSELDKGAIEGFGRGNLYAYFRNNMHIVSR